MQTRFHSRAKFDQKMGKNNLIHHDSIVCNTTIIIIPVSYFSFVLNKYVSFEATIHNTMHKLYKYHVTQFIFTY